MELKAVPKLPKPKKNISVDKKAFKIQKDFIGKRRVRSWRAGVN